MSMQHMNCKIGKKKIGLTPSKDRVFSDIPVQTFRFIKQEKMFKAYWGCGINVIKHALKF